jgi:DNA-binding response OmpR family regulator
MAGTREGSEDRVLLVEDDMATARAMTRLMESVGFKVSIASTLAEGLAGLATMPALVVLDLMLPDGSGLEVLEAIRRGNLRSKVAVVSASTELETFERMRKSQPDAIFPKPVDFQDFADWLCETFAGASHEHSKAA